MTPHHPVSPFDPDGIFEADVDLLSVNHLYLKVRDRATGRKLLVAYDGIAIGANARGDAYTLIMPRVLAQMQGFCE